MVATPLATAYDAALRLLQRRPLLALTGAGVSTDSGIPDYRGPRPTATSVPQPMTGQEFASSGHARQRYWARSHLGWARMGGAEPNDGHHALARLDPHLLITQNVDGLHERAGSARVVALHGRIAEVRCLTCGEISARARLQERLSELNPTHLAEHGGAIARPDGDVDLASTDAFVVPPCETCAGVLKPHVVFFGDNVPAARVEQCFAAVDTVAARHGVLLVAGSSLTVMSGLRFVRRAATQGVPIVIVNRGATRGDSLAAYKIEAGCSDFLTALAGEP